MSGHSKWSTIKRAKGAKDFKKGQAYTKLTKSIIEAARGGADPELNFKLRIAIQKAKEANMSSDTINGAIRKGSGKDSSSSMLEQVEYEAYGPGGSVMIIDALTDNRNRTISNLRAILERNGGMIVTAGAISWQFKVYGYIGVKISTDNEISWNKVPKKSIKGRKDEFELEMLEIDGIQDIDYEDETTYLLTSPEQLDNVRKYLEKENYDVVSAELIKLPNEMIKLDESDDMKLRHLIDLLDEDEDVQSIWVNV